MSRRGENIRKRSDGRWEGRYMICSSDGHKKYRSVYSRTYKGVKQKLMKFKVTTVILQADPNETDVNHLSMTIEDYHSNGCLMLRIIVNTPPTVNMRAFMRSTSKNPLEIYGQRNFVQR